MAYGYETAVDKQIRTKIDQFDIQGAQKLLAKTPMEARTAETHYLASMLAEDNHTKQQYLEWALEKDPFHQEAYVELQRLEGAPQAPQLDWPSELDRQIRAKLDQFDVDGARALIQDLTLEEYTAETCYLTSIMSSHSGTPQGKEIQIRWLRRALDRDPSHRAAFEELKRLGALPEDAELPEPAQPSTPVKPREPAGPTDLDRQARRFIDQFDLDAARRLLEKGLVENPTAETYYLASMVAPDQAQKEYFLQKALEVSDYFHKEAYNEWLKMHPELTGPKSVSKQPTGPIETSAERTPQDMAPGSPSKAKVRGRVGVDVRPLKKVAEKRGGFSVDVKRVAVLAGTLIALLVAAYVAIDPGTDHAGLVDPDVEPGWGEDRSPGDSSAAGICEPPEDLEPDEGWVVGVREMGQAGIISGIGVWEVERFVAGSAVPAVDDLRHAFVITGIESKCRLNSCLGGRAGGYGERIAAFGQVIDIDHMDVTDWQQVVKGDGGCSKYRTLSRDYRYKSVLLSICPSSEYYVRPCE